MLLLLLVGVGPLLFLPTRQSRARSGSSTDDQFDGALYRGENQYWAGGILYNNPDDPALFVPKRFGLGWTVNIGHPQGKLLLIGTLSAGRTGLFCATPQEDLG